MLQVGILYSADWHDKCPSETSKLPFQKLQSDLNKIIGCEGQYKNMFLQFSESVWNI